MRGGANSCSYIYDVKEIKVMQKLEIKRGRPSKVKQVIEFNPTDVKLFRGSDLSFSDDLFKPMKTNREIDIILSTEGGLMPGTNIVLAGGPGSGKSTIALDMLADYTRQGLKCLFVSGEMDEIAHYKYCKRLPKFSCVQTLFLKNYALNHLLNDQHDTLHQSYVSNGLNQQIHQL